MKIYLLTANAEHDLDIIKNYFRQEGGQKLARKILKKINASLQFLGNTPGAGHGRPDLTSDPVKCWQVFSYLIIYDPIPRPIHILRILHTSRHLEMLLKR